MKSLFFAFLFLFPSQTLFAQLQDTELFMSGSYDKTLIQSHKIKTVDIQMLIGQKSMFYNFNFDRQGKLEKQSILDSLRKPVKEYYFEYNLKGDFVRKIEIDLELNEKQVYNYQNSYNGTRLISQKCTELLTYVKHTYSSQGKKLLTEIFIGKDTLNVPRTVSTYTYDDLGRLTIKNEMSSYKGEVSYRETFNYSYDEQNRIWLISKSDQSRTLSKYHKDNLLKTVEKKLNEDPGRLSLVDVYNYQFWK